MQLRDYQLEIKATVETLFSNGCRSVMCQMPTGTGKTVVLSSIIKEFLGSDRAGSQVLVVAHRREILEQIIDTLKTNELSAELSRGSLVVESIQRLTARLKVSDGSLPTPSFVIIDEAHHSQAKTYKVLWDKWPNARFLGMTATPCRLKNEGFTDLFDKLVCAWNVKRFIMEGWLADYEYVVIKPDSEIKTRIDNLKKRGIDGDYQVKEMGTVMDNRASIEQLYRTYKQYATGRQGIIYAINREHAEHIRCYYEEQGENIMLIDSNTTKIQRDALMKKYREGKIQIFVNCEIAGEGVDVPNVSFIQLARPTLSLSKYLQQVGRGLRPNPNKEKTIILDNVGMYYMFGLPNEDRDWQKMFKGGQVLPSVNVQSASGDRARHIQTHDYDQGHDFEMTVVNKPQESRAKVAIEKKYRGHEQDYILTRNGKVIADKCFSSAYGFVDGIVRFGSYYDAHYYYYDDNGTFLYESARKCEILPQKILKSNNQRGINTYIDLLMGQEYQTMPHVWTVGNASFVEATDGWHLRHKCYAWIVVNRNDVKSLGKISCFKDIVSGKDYVLTDAQIVMRLLGRDEDGSLILSNDNNGHGVLMSYKDGSFFVYSNNKDNKWMYSKWSEALRDKPIARAFDQSSVICDKGTIEVFRRGNLYGWKKGSEILCDAKFMDVVCFSTSKYVLVTSKKEPRKNIVVDLSGNIVYDKHHVERLVDNYAVYRESDDSGFRQYAVYLPECYETCTDKLQMDIEGFHFQLSYDMGDEALCYFPTALLGAGFYLTDIYAKNGVLHATHIKTRKEIIGFINDPNRFYFLLSANGNEWVLSEVTQQNLSGDSGLTIRRPMRHRYAMARTSEKSRYRSAES